MNPSTERLSMSMKNHCRRCGQWHEATLPCHTPDAILIFAARQQGPVQRAVDDLENTSLAHYLLNTRGRG
jgi:hypothetical protein